MLIRPEPIARSLTRRCAEPGNLSAADSGTATLSIGTELGRRAPDTNNNVE